jgi:hypothetical protein
MSEPIITQAKFYELRALVEAQHTETMGVRTVTLRALFDLVEKQREALSDIDGIEHAHLCDCVACSEIGEVARAALACLMGATQTERNAPEQD